MRYNDNFTVLSNIRLKLQLYYFVRYSKEKYTISEYFTQNAPHVTTNNSVTLLPNATISIFIFQNFFDIPPPSPLVAFGGLVINPLPLQKILGTPLERYMYM